MRLVVTIVVVTASMLVPNVSRADEGFRHSGAVFAATSLPGVEDPELLVRCMHQLDVFSNGSFGEIVEVPPPYGEGGHRFVLLDGRMSMTDGLPLSDGIDFDVAFVGELGMCPEPVPGATRFRNPGNEEGIVPGGTRYAIVTMATPHRPNSSYELLIGA